MLTIEHVITRNGVTNQSLDYKKVKITSLSPEMTMNL